MKPPPLPSVDPDLRVPLAKSDGESLVEHTWHVLSRLADLRRLRPALADEAACPRLWTWLYWGTFLHDFGKVADGFQAVLQRKARRWGFRHEALSLAFVDWLFPPGSADRPYVIAAIACHHRDAEIIHQTYLRNDDPDEDSATKLIAQTGEASIRRLYRWLEEYGWPWAEVLGFAPVIERPPLPPLETARTMIVPETIHRAVNALQRYTESLKFRANPAAVMIGALLRGIILTSDHAGSAHSEAFLPAPLDRSVIVEALEGRPLFAHQEAADEQPSGSMLLISPTSSGKTEAALLWLARQQSHDGRPAPRIFYLLPYQASMNAAHRRLQRHFPGENAVGLQHSRMMQALYAQALADDADNETAVAYAHQQRALADLLRFPVTVASPYQLLKVPYQLKGFEALLTHFYGGRFILDEIHAYEPKRMALIVAVMAFLAQYAHARFCIMTATLPPQVRDILAEALPGLKTIRADDDTFRRFQRHRLHILPGDLLDPTNLEHIVQDAADKSILICCNTVRRAVEVHAALHSALRNRYPDDPDCKVVLLHSRFNSRDRTEKENAILARTGVGSEKRARTIVVATQVIEVSLNIDLDTLYSEAAPLEALLQRFGRVNRGRGHGAPLADVYVVREQPEAVRHVYKPDLIEAALACLAEADGQPIDEGRIDQWLAHVYVGEALVRWRQEYDERRAEFEREVLSSLRPFNASGLDDLFYQMFDSVDVLPSNFLNVYDEAIKEGRYLEAASWLVPVAWRDYKRLERMGKAWREDPAKKGRSLYAVSVPYDSDFGLDLSGQYQKGNSTDSPRIAMDSYEVPPEAD